MRCESQSDQSASVRICEGFGERFCECLVPRYDASVNLRCAKSLKDHVTATVYNILGFGLGKRSSYGEELFVEMSRLELDHLQRKCAHSLHLAAVRLISTARVAE